MLMLSDKLINPPKAGYVWLNFITACGENQLENYSIEKWPFWSAANLRWIVSPKVIRINFNVHKWYFIFFSIYIYKLYSMVSTYWVILQHHLFVDIKSQISI